MSWEWTFIIQAIAIVPCLFAISLAPEKYLNVEEIIQERKRIQREVSTTQIVTIDTAIGSHSDSGSVSQVDRTPPESMDHIAKMIYIKRALMRIQYQNQQAIAGFTADLNENYIQIIKDAFSNCVYFGLVMAITGIYFVMTGVQYWITPYLSDIMEADDEMVVVYFVILSFTAPILGCILGGFFTTCVGGYNSTAG